MTNTTDNMDWAEILRARLEAPLDSLLEYLKAGNPADIYLYNRWLKKEGDKQLADLKKQLKELEE